MESILDQLDEVLRHYDFNGDKRYNKYEIKYLIGSIFKCDKRTERIILDKYFSWICECGKNVNFRIISQTLIKIQLERVFCNRGSIKFNEFLQLIKKCTSFLVYQPKE